jgi:hypothetical protein
MNFELIYASKDCIDVIKSLMQFYIYDFSNKSNILFDPLHKYMETCHFSLSDIPPSDGGAVYSITWQADWQSKSGFIKPCADHL